MYVRKMEPTMQKLLGTARPEDGDECNLGCPDLPTL
jgi:hypothetical protein